jgi:CheY-like chemotaxis protein
LARVEASYIDLKSEPFNPNELLEAVHALLEFRAKEKQLDLHIECGKAVPSSLLGDFGKLRQVLLNLVSNALKFTERGGVQVRMDVDSVSGDVAHVRIEVADTGIGIHASDFDKLFRKFSQVHSGNTRRYPGSGLGLAICRSLVEAMDGSLAVSSKQGEGTTFSCLIPLAIDTADKRAEAAANGPVGANKSIQRINRGHVLLAEDNLINRRICEDFLRRLGVNYVAVSNGSEALQQLSKQRFDLVLMDIQMPVMDGVAATRQIRDGAAGEANRDISIIALTAHAIHGDQQRFLQQGMSDYIAKPMMMGTFAEKLRHWLPSDQVYA